MALKPGVSASASPNHSSRERVCVGGRGQRSGGFCAGNREALGGEKKDPVDKVVFILVGRQTLQQ